jgi:hypothetical protein
VRADESIEIGKPVEEVFGYVSEVGHYPQWMAHVLDVRKETPRTPKTGDRFTVAFRSVGRRFETPYERISYEPGRGYADRAVGGPIPGHRWNSDFQEVPAGTCLTRAVQEGFGVLKLLQPLQKWVTGRQLRKDLRTLKALLESG